MDCDDAARGNRGGTTRRRWYRRRAVSIPLGILGALFVLGAVGNIVDPSRRTVLTTAANTVDTGTPAPSTTVPPTTVPPTTVPATATFPDLRTRTTSCRMNGADPDHGCTPGALNPAVTQASMARTICVPGYTATIRPLTAGSDRLKQQAAAAYGITEALSAYQGDHLIPLELGGAADDPANFWDQPNRMVLADGTAVSSDQKDALENALKARVCDGRITLLDAQRRISTGWYGAWAAVVQPASSLSSTTTTTTTVRTAAALVTTTTPLRTTVVGPSVPAARTAPATTSAPGACPTGTYVNASGNTVCSPYAAPAPPGGATAQCNDGSYSMSQHRQGTCSGHGGVRQFL